MNRTPDIFASLRTEIGSAPSVDLPAIIGQLEAIKAEAFARLVTPQAAAPADDDELLTPDEAAQILKQTSRWVRRHAHELPRVAVPGRLLRFSKRKLVLLANRRQHG